MSLTASATHALPVSDRCTGFITRLLSRCGTGDETALGDLFDLTYFLVAGIVGRGATSSPGIDDKVVEAFVRIWQRSPTYQAGGRGALAWIIDQAHDGQASSHPRH